MHCTVLYREDITDSSGSSSEGSEQWTEIDVCGGNFNTHQRIMIKTARKTCAPSPLMARMGLETQSSLTL